MKLRYLSNPLGNERWLAQKWRFMILSLFPEEKSNPRDWPVNVSHRRGTIDTMPQHSPLDPVRKKIVVVRPTLFK
jgi:hypothetical protein